MKKIYLLVLLIAMFSGINAQYIYNDFDANQNEAFGGDPNMPTIIANPDVSGINMSANVAEWVRSEEQWAHAFCEVEGTIDFSTGTVFEIKVHSPIACEVLFKLEDKNNQGVFTELSANVTTPGEWVQLSYDFAGAQSGLYSKIVVFFDFSTLTDHTFYFDDVQGPEYTAGGTGDPVTLPVTFDDDEVNYALTDFGGNVSEIIVDPDNAANKIAQSIKTEAAETWAGTTVGGVVGFPTPIPFAEGSTSMSVAVWSPTSGTPIRLKVEQAFVPTVSVETETLTTVAGDWEILVFDFSNEAPGTEAISFDKIYNKASIFFNFDTDGATAGEQTYYWDDMEFVGGGTEPKPLLALDVQDNFEDDGSGTISDWNFQDSGELVDLTITTDPVNAENHVADYMRSGSFEWTNAQFILDHRMDLSARNKFELKVYFPSSNDYSGDLTSTAAIKLQNSLLGPDAWTTQTEIKLDVTEFDTWVTLLFDFEAISDYVDYDQVVVQLGGEGHLTAGQFYFDDLYLSDNSAISEYQMIQTSVYPNPANDVLYLEKGDQFEQVSIYSISGQMVYQSNVSIRSIDLKGMPTGMYSLQAKDADNKLHYAKFIVE